MRGRRLLPLALLVALVVAGCGGDGEEIAVPVRVDQSLAPALVGDNLKLHANTEAETVAAFANAGERSMVADGKVWEIRRADRLVGALQISTVLPEVDLGSESIRGTIVRQIIPGAQTRIRIDAVEVFTTVVNDKAVFVWFGEGIYQILQIKDRELEGAYEEVATDIIRHQATTSAWTPLPDVLEDS